MTHSKLSHSLFLAALLGAFALVGNGCAMNAGESPTEETAQSTESDLRKSPASDGPTNAAEQLGDEQSTARQIVPKAAIAPKLIGTDHILGGGEDNDGPRPHPWQPAPDKTSSDNNTNSGSSGTSSTK